MPMLLSSHELIRSPSCDSVLFIRSMILKKENSPRSKRSTHNAGRSNGAVPATLVGGIFFHSHDGLSFIVEAAGRESRHRR